MKRIIYVISVLLFTLTLIKCNNQGKTDQPAKTENPPRKKVYVNNNKDFDNPSIKDLEVHPKGDYRRDSGAFHTKFIVGHLLSASDSFPIFISELMSSMQTTLGITEATELDPHGHTIINAIRVYPALSPANNMLYLVFLGEEWLVNAPGDTTVTSMVDSVYYQILDGRFAKLTTDDEKAVAKTDIAGFRTFWDNQPQVGSLNRSYAFSIGDYYDKLGPQHLGIFGELQIPASPFGIILYPCLENNKLIFVFKGFQMITGAHRSFEHKFFYDNMDVCPTKCPEVEL